ncbi:hypothetical protein [Noviherbaspirillum sp. Root189]|uniref:hypothetical protein n=1 Tax=Noviherbaspirillum sp. Root189 TaxID=1736487 RepID=UPI00071403D6|nr:hypothetical protein [Noviherbaspirillum sp. Root189]KRB92841.1 hypothetical protein ASE07_14485 [Noviherbaspirillum sp. Root189]
MDQYQIMSLLMRLETKNVEPETVAMMYAEVLSSAAERLTPDELRQLLIIGAYICHGPGGSGHSVEERTDEPQWRGNHRIN